ncbi:AraC family transcriptional regulator [Winogradskyella sp. PC-19]|uniref:AraC family transcriptional regulator n=1 Tax=unclassified Winogradskyella TaxID=2615021 RepID=UPI000B3D1064|nr:MULTISPECIES: AraC family transcriptional regulator [unclassified Winogradskyella]ARV09598.1 AraC family transcriptional regulator [Winogradskyella sp. PC-19]
MKKRKPVLEKITPAFGSSIHVHKHGSYVGESIPYWHFHPEIELVYINKGRGKRHIGNHLSYYNNSQLLLLGSNLPHYGFVDRLTLNGSETVVQFRPDFLGDEFFNTPEMIAISHLLERSKMGILFGKKTKKKLGYKIENLPAKSGIERILLLLEILNELTCSEDYKVLNADGFVFEIEPQDNAKINMIYKHINENFQRHISLSEISEKVSMSIPAFCRYFKKVTGKTFTKLVNEYRIVHATKLLSESQMSITDISFECGFNNFSHFNKLFKEFTGNSASKYRSQLKQMIK